MGAVGYTSTLADRDYYLAVRQRERAAIQAAPHAAREEIRRTYAGKGFSGELLDRIVDTLTSRPDRWLATVTDDVLHLRPVETRDAMRSAVVITAATLVGHLIPLLPFLWLARTSALAGAIVLSALVLFGVGVYSARSLVGDWRRSGLKMLAIGLGAAAIGFAIGSVFHSTT
jgi:VIT1/CCC1 family predicted Fe2+/Mn2+ transporter